MSEIVYEQATPSDTAEIVEFHNNEALRNWEDEFLGYRREDGVFFLAKSDGKVIGTQGLMPYMMNIDGVSTLVSRSERTRVSKDFRGKGISGKLYKACSMALQHSCFIFGSTTATKALSRIGFRVEPAFSLHLVSAISVANVYRCFMNSSQLGFRDFIDAVRKRDMWRGLEYAKLFVSLPSIIVRLLSGVFRIIGSSELEVSKTLRSKEDISKLFERVRGKGHLIYLEQEESFLAWHERMSGPSKKYYAYKDGELQGYVICIFTNSESATILDFAALSSCALSQLLQCVLADAKDKAYVKLSFNYRCKHLKKHLFTLMLAGFIPVYRGGNEVLMPIGQTTPEAYDDISNFYITEIWHSLGSYQ